MRDEVVPDAKAALQESVAQPAGTRQAMTARVPDYVAT